MTVRVGVIGTGFGARVVAPVFGGTDGCEVVDVVSPRDDGAALALCRRSDVDLVAVHSPPFLHGRHVRAAIEAGHAVLCDKPFGLDADESDDLLAAAEAADVLHFVNFEFRRDPTRALLRQLLVEGVIGRSEHAVWTHISAGARVPPRPFGWLFERSKGGGWIGAGVSHMVDAVRWLLGEIDDVVARRHLAVPEHRDGDGASHAVDVEDGLTAVLTLESGASVVLDSTFAATATLAPRFVVTGTAGVLECVADQRITVRLHDGTREEVEGPANDGDRHLAGMRNWAADVRDAVVTGEQIAPNFADGVACDRVLDRMRAVPLIGRGTAL